MKRRLAFCAIFFIVAGTGGSAMAQLWTEVGDAGELLSTAQAVLGSGPLNTITGAYGTYDTDMYEIYISNPAGFSARAFTAVDPELFLFDASGMGVYWSDDDISGVSWSLQSYLPPGHTYSPTSAGNYYLAITNYSSQPFSAGGNIFSDWPIGPAGGVGGGSPLTGWSGSSGAGSYRIELTGAEYVPVPGAVLLGMIGLGVAGIKLRRHRTS